MLKNFAISIIQTLRQRGFQAYLAGGCVRDLLLNRDPADYDVATSATPAQVMEIFPDTYAVGAHFGVVLIPVLENCPVSPVPSVLKPFAESHQSPQEVCASAGAGTIEVATFRSDLSYSDGRHPDEVRFSGDSREDVARRDFTINGMMLDPVTNEVLDFVGGRQDLQAGIIRAIGDPGRRFAEDKLRMLRAVRFAARFQYAIEEPDTLGHSATRARNRNGLARAGSRRTHENAHGGQWPPCLSLWIKLDCSKKRCPRSLAMKGVAQPPEFHPEGDVFAHTLLLLENLPRPCPPTLAWGALLHDVGKPATFRVRRTVFVSMGTSMLG